MFDQHGTIDQQARLLDKLHMGQDHQGAQLINMARGLKPNNLQERITVMGR